MTTNKSSKDTSSPKKGVAKEEDKGLMSIAEVRMLLYVVPIALVLALFVYIITR
jgi:hypothetical protein